MTKEDKGLLLALGIGDGYLRMQSKTSAELTVCHGPKQKGYVQQKAQLMSQILKKPIKVRFKPRNDGTVRYVATAYDKSLKFIYRALYRNGRKTLSFSVLNRLSDAGFCLWYMDDGTISAKKIRAFSEDSSINYRIKSWEAVLCTVVPHNEALICIKVFEKKFGITPKLRGHTKKDGSVGYSLRFNTADLKVLLPRLKPYASPDLLYKFPEIVTGHVK